MSNKNCGNPNCARCGGGGDNDPIKAFARRILGIAEPETKNEEPDEQEKLAAFEEDTFFSDLENNGATRERLCSLIKLLVENLDHRKALEKFVKEQADRPMASVSEKLSHLTAIQKATKNIEALKEKAKKIDKLVTYFTETYHPEISTVLI